MDENKLSNVIIGAAIEVHRILGPGLLESAYHTCMMKELRDNNLAYESEAPVYAIYKGEKLSDIYRLDFLVESKVIIEIKAVEKLTNTHKAQLLTYLRLTNKKLGILINFNEAALKNGLRRVVNKL